jgi:hypothetical protein
MSASLVKPMTNISQQESKSFFTIPNILGIVGFALGFIGFGMQFFTTSHGSSGQIDIDDKLKTTTWIVLSSVILCIIGAIYYIYFKTTSMPYFLIFILAFSSFFFSNFALLLSLRQVNVVKTN